MHDTTDDGRAHRRWFSEFCARAGGTIVSATGTAKDQKDYTAELTRIRAQKPEVIYYGGLTPDGVRVEVQMDRLGIDGLAPHRVVRRGIGVVPEGRRVFPKMSVEENLRMGAFAEWGAADLAGRLAHVFELFPRLRERRAQRAATMSGGEQAMLAMGRALMARPALLLLDEPSLGLSPVLVEQLFAIVEAVNRRGTTVFLVEQNATDAVRHAYLSH
jgi:branched-chain amino acid transport system ATP-binding protein